METGLDARIPDRDASSLTLEQFQRLPEDEWRSELVRGKLVREPPAGMAHGRIAARIASLIVPLARERGLGAVFTAETGFILSDEPPTVRAPDVAFVSRERLPSDDLPEGFGRLAPDLAVEVASPSNTAAELHGKVLDYLEAGTRIVWLIEPGTGTVTVYRSRDDIRLLREEDELDGGDLLPGLLVPVADLFGP